DVVVGLFLDRLQRRRRLLHSGDRADLPATGPARPAGGREGMTAAAPQAVVSRSATGSRFTAAIKDAAITALITFARFLPLIGFKTVQNMRNELELETRFPLLLSIVAIVAGTRLFWSLVIEPWRERRALNPPPESARMTAFKHAFAEWFTPFA